MNTAKSSQPWTPVSLLVAISLGLAAFLMLGQVLIWIGDSFSRFQAEQAARASRPNVAKDRATMLRAVTVKVTYDVTRPLARTYDTEGYAKLGKRAWAVSNDLRRWAALSAAESEKCDHVSAVAVWKMATRSKLSWHVLCSNGERFIISEEHARRVKAKLDPAATMDEKKRYPAPAETATPMSAVWDSFNESGAVIACENLLKDASVNRASFNTAGLPSVEREDDTGRATIYRDYSSDNALGGTISGKYQCLVDATGEGRVLTLKTRDAFGLHSVFDQARQ